MTKKVKEKMPNEKNIENKRCCTCKNTISIVNFHKNKSTKDGYDHTCKSCKKIHCKKWYNENIDEISKKSKKRYHENPQKYAKIYKKWRSENPDKDKNRKLLWNFGITREQYLEILNNQNNSCKICKLSKEEYKKEFDVDHCHKTDQIRGLLCNNCNRGLGHFKDNTEFLENAIKYLKEKA